MAWKGFFDIRGPKNSRRRRAAYLAQIALALAFLVQFPVNCISTDPGGDGDSDTMGAYFDNKVPEDILTGFGNGFIVMMKPGSEMVRQAAFDRLYLKPAQQFKAINAVRMDLNVNQLKELVKDEAVVWVAPNREVKASWSIFNSSEKEIPSDILQRTAGVDQIRSQLYKDNVSTFTGTTGAGVGVAVLDSGMANHKDIKSRIVAAMDFTFDAEGDDPDEQGSTNDGYGHGTHVAGLIAGTGEESCDDGYDHQFAGVAPRANLINLRVLDDSGAGYVSNVLAAIDWAIEHKAEYNIRVMNMSLGVPPMSSYKTDPLAVACARAVQAGIVVVAAAGNYGEFEDRPIYGAIMSPAYSPYVIAVGAADTNGTAIRSDDTVAPFSSKGPTLFDGLPKPDVVAPGVGARSTMSENGFFLFFYPEHVVDPCDEGADCLLGLGPQPEYMRMSGTSMAAPVVSGAAALVIQANPSLTPNAVKAIVMGTAQVIDGELYISQGAGLLNVEGAVRLAYKIRDLSEVQFGETWVFEETEPVSVIEDEQVAWSQGVGWTGSIVTGPGVTFTYQPVYAFDAVWGQGVGWTGSVTYDYDPVWYGDTQTTWEGATINPMSLPDAGEDVLMFEELDWTQTPEFIGPEHPAFPIMP